jgi:hypothetical protein
MVGFTCFHITEGDTVDMQLAPPFPIQRSMQIESFKTCSNCGRGSANSSRKTAFQK